MKKNLPYWLFAVAGVCLAGTWLVELPVDNSTNKQLTAVTEVVNALSSQPVETLVEEKVIDLPEDGGAYYLTLFVDANPKASVDSRKLIGWFEGDPRLAGLKAQCHTKIVGRNDPLFQNRYANRLASAVDLPAVCLQRPDGRVVYRRHNSTMPKTSAQMATQISECFPRPKPQPAPVPPPVVPAVPSLVDVGGEEEVVEENDPTAILAMLSAALFGAGGVASSWKKSNL